MNNCQVIVPIAKLNIRDALFIYTKYSTESYISEYEAVILVVDTHIYEKYFNGTNGIWSPNKHDRGYLCDICYIILRISLNIFKNILNRALEKYNGVFGNS